jgi:hypothetical protein
MLDTHRDPRFSSTSSHRRGFPPNGSLPVSRPHGH